MIEKFAVQWDYVLYLRGLSVFLVFLMGFSVKSNGVGTIEWGFSKMDGVPVGLVKSQWGCLESQWV